MSATARPKFSLCPHREGNKQQMFEVDGSKQNVVAEERNSIQPLRGRLRSQRRQPQPEPQWPVLRGVHHHDGGRQRGERGAAQRQFFSFDSMATGPRRKPHPWSARPAAATAATMTWRRRRHPPEDGHQRDRRWRRPQGRSAASATPPGIATHRLSARERVPTGRRTTPPPPNGTAARGGGPVDTPAPALQPWRDPGRRHARRLARRRAAGDRRAAGGRRPGRRCAAAASLRRRGSARRRLRLRPGAAPGRAARHPRPRAGTTPAPAARRV